MYLHLAKIKLSHQQAAGSVQLREIKNIFHKELDEIYPKEEVDSFFYMLIAHYLKLERFILALQPSFTIAKEDEQPLFEALVKLKLEEPIQHILGTTHFMDLDFIVNKNVLIPRPETEELVRWIIEEVRGKEGKEAVGLASKTFRVLDIGTGSGCIAISLAKNLPHAKVYALDISGKALDMARQNALKNEVEVEFLEADILNLKSVTQSAVEGLSLSLNFDLIVSNPPYVREQEKSEMQKNVLEYEPEQALFVSNENPLKFYKAIADFAKHSLNPGGSLYLETNQYLAKETQQLLQDHNFSEIQLRKDMFGNDRMLKGVINRKTDLA